jgi:integrase/recombinase XerD
MRYELDCKESFDKSLLFWIKEYIRSKLNSLSNRQVDDQESFQSLFFLLSSDIEDIKELHNIAKSARNIGLIGVQVYMTPLKKLYEFLSKKPLVSLKNIDEETLKEFLSIYTSSLSDASKKNYRISLINFFGFIDKQNLYKDETSYKFQIELKNWSGLGGKSGQKLPEYMKEEEIERFLKALEEYPFKELLAHRNRLVIKMIIFTGIRVSEALYLHTKDIAKEDSFYTIRIRGKGNKYRVVMIKAAHIEKELDSVMSFSMCEQGYLFCNKKKRPLTQAYVSRMVENILKSVGIRKEKNGAHMLRHTFATLLYHKRKDLLLVQEALGHADLNTSRIYTHFDKDRLKLAADVMDDLK